MKIWLTALMLLATAACSGGPDEAAKKVRSAPSETEAEIPMIVASNYPLAFFVAKIAGGVAGVKPLAPRDEDPAFWQPTPEEVIAMQEADLIVLNGASYESWLKGVSLPPSRMVVTADTFRDRWIPLEGQTTHSHGPEGEHEHSGTAFTTWLDPTLALLQAGVIAEALSARWPEHAGRFEAGLAELTEALTALDAAAGEAVGVSPQRPVLFSHPVYQYLERRYELVARSVHWEPDQLPDEAAWEELEGILAEFPASWMIWESAPLPETSERLESIGVRSAVFDPSASAPAEGDFLSIMTANVEALRRVFAVAELVG